MNDRPFGDRHGPTPDEMRRAFDARTAMPPRPEPSRYDRLGPLARALVDDYDAIDLAEMLVKAQDELAALRMVARGYCPHCGRGDAGITTDQWEQQRQRTDQAETAIARVRRLADGWVKAGPPPLGTPVSRWWDKRLVELLAALDEPAAGPAATQATDERCSLDASETEPNTWTEPAHDRPCTATIEGRATPGGRQVQCTREAGHPENHVGPKQGSNGRVLWTDSNAGAVPHRRG
jgi:hypothetical protein